jgi:sugar transferase (PEP-CTERM/EpsH1 system associated)
MAKVLFLAHRVPFPPDKGDKIRAFHMLQHLAERHEVWLGAGADDLMDLEHVPAMREWCVDLCVAPLGKPRRLANMATAMVRNAPLSVARFRHPMLERWIDTVLRDVRPDLVFVFSSALGQYVLGRLPGNATLVVDFVDADAEKWRAYAGEARGPMRWIYRREARLLAGFERTLLQAATAGLLISEIERRLMAQLVGDQAHKLQVVPNGVDTDYFDVTPAQTAVPEIVLCGRMDYLPNIDAAQWFAHDILPKVRQACPDALFRIVGAAPTTAVTALRQLRGVDVVGAVPDVRPYLARAAAVVAPLRIARGIQNKVLEGMSAARPVVATPQALEGIAAQVGRDVLVGEDAEAFAGAVSAVLQNRAPAGLGRSAREFVLGHHRWSAQLAALDAIIAGRA